MTTSNHARSTTPLHAAFLALIPRIERHGRVYFRGLNNADKLEELLAEMVALSWRWYLRLSERGRDVTRFASALAAFAARAVRSGRRLCGQEKSKEVMSPVAQKRRGFSVQSLPDYGALAGNPLDEALADNTVTPVHEQVAFRLDFPRWLSSHSCRDRSIALDMMAGERTLDLAHKYTVSPGRISQMRTQFLDSWIRFQGGPAADA